MLKSYIYQEEKNNWLEIDQNLLLHDLCAFLDEEAEHVWIWNGPKSTIERLEKGFDSIVDLTSSYPDATLQLTILTEDIPSDIQKKLDEMLAGIREKEAEVQQFSRIASIRSYFILSLVTIILPIISILNLYLSLFWPISDGNAEISANNYNIWLMISITLMIISLIFFALKIGVGILEMEHEVITYSSIGLIICFGIILYLFQGINIFLFQEGSTSSIYLISPVDLVIFLVLNLIAILIFEIVNINKFLVFYNTYRKFIF
ncbi:MAG: hypothetical protein ACTSRI_05535 [Promethearchaeota archaeon]